MDKAGRSHLSRWLSRADRHASRPLAAVLVIGAAGVWIAVSIVAGFPARWETVFQTLVAAVTLTMVFVIQHTQARHQRATQRKLDEILVAMPGADNSHSSMLPMNSCETLDTSIGKSTRPHSMVVSRLARASNPSGTRPQHPR